MTSRLERARGSARHIASDDDERASESGDGGEVRSREIATEGPVRFGSFVRSSSSSDVVARRRASTDVGFKRTNESRDRPIRSFVRSFVERARGRSGDGGVSGVCVCVERAFGASWIDRGAVVEKRGGDDADGVVDEGDAARRGGRDGGETKGR
jgi:hypothetical protein